jgi:hypothetical protein
VAGGAGVGLQTVKMIDAALAEACVRLGFCTRLDGTSLMKKYSGKMTARDFAASVHFAEGMEFKSSKHTKSLEQIFEKFCC